MTILSNKNFNIEWIDFPQVKNRSVRGVYMIGDSIYIGASKHIRKRVLSHFHNAKRGSDVNTKIKEYFSTKTENNLPLKVTFLSDNTDLERCFQDKLMPKRLVSKFERNYHQIYK